MGILKNIKSLLAAPKTEGEIFSLLLDAIDDGEIDRAREILTQNPHLVNTSDSSGVTPLMVALKSKRRDLKFVNYLITTGADVNASEEDGATPLHFAIANEGDSRTGGWPERYISALLGAGARLEAKTFWGWTPLIRAVIEGSDEEIASLVRAGANTNARLPLDTIPPDYSGYTLTDIAEKCGRSLAWKMALEAAGK